MKNITIDKMNNLLRSELKYKKAHYDYLTTFSYLETLISYCIASHYCNSENDKMNFTLSFLSNLSRPKLFEEFLLVLEKRQINKSGVFNNFREINDFRNDFAHSYYVPKKENLKKGFCITKIYRSNKLSNVEGFTKIISDDEYLKKFAKMEDLILEVYNVYVSNFNT